MKLKSFVSWNLSCLTSSFSSYPSSFRKHRHQELNSLSGALSGASPPCQRSSEAWPSSCGRGGRL